MSHSGAQRRQAIVLFADLKGSTAMAEKLGEEATFNIIREVHARILTEIEKYGGTVQEFRGDGVMALFGAPRAIEDAPLRACRSALAIQTAMGEATSDIHSQYGLRPKLRIGLHAGVMIVGDVGTPEHKTITALGDAVNLASRVQDAAEAGTILISSELHELVAGHVDSTFIGRKIFKGKSEPQKIYRLERVKQGITRFDAAHRHGLSRLIGRDQELGSLNVAWRRALSGSMRVACVIGAAGIGKSRLIYEFRSQLFDKDAFILDGNCSSDGINHPFLPFIDVVKRSFHIDSTLNAEQVNTKLRRGLKVLNIKPESILPYLSNLLGHQVSDPAFEALDSGVVGIRTRDAIQAMLRARCRLTPTVMFLEDLHWADTASANLVDQLVNDSEVKQLLIVCTFRPDYTAAWIVAEKSSILRLSPLARAMTADLILSRLGVDEVPSILIDMVQEKAEGNPLFVEEVVNYLLQTGRLRKTDGELRFETESEISRLPITVENMLMERVDRLPTEARIVLNAAAIVGRTFDADIVAQVAKIEVSAASCFQMLTDEDLITTGSDGELLFKHALLRDAIYFSMLLPERQLLHQEVAAILENRHFDRLPEVADVLAHHYSRTILVDKAARFLALAGEKCLRVYSLDEAQALFCQALVLIEANPGSVDEGSFVDVVLNMARVHYFFADFKSILDLGGRYLSRVEKLGNKRRLSRFLFEVGYANSFAANHETSKLLLERALKLGQEIKDDEAIGYATMGLLQYFTWGEPASNERRAQARRLGERAFEIGIRINDVWLASKALAALSTERAAWGRPDEARLYGDQLFVLSEHTGNPRPHCEGLYRRAYACGISGDYEDAIKYADRSLALSLSPIDRILGRHPKAVALILSGRNEEGLSLIRELRNELQTGGLRIFELFVDLPYGVALVRKGELAKGVRHIVSATDRAARSGQSFARSYGEWLLGDIFLQMVRSGKKLSVSLIVRNLYFLLRTLPFAAVKARHHLNIAVEESRARDIPAQLVKGLYDLGLLNETQNRFEEARTCYEEAHSVANAIDADTIKRNIETRLAVI